MLSGGGIGTPNTFPVRQFRSGMYSSAAAAAAVYITHAIFVLAGLVVKINFAIGQVHARLEVLRSQQDFRIICSMIYLLALGS